MFSGTQVRVRAGKGKLEPIKKKSRAGTKGAVYSAGVTTSYEYPHVQYQPAAYHPAGVPTSYNAHYQPAPADYESTQHHSARLVQPMNPGIPEPVSARFAETVDNHGTNASYHPGGGRAEHQDAGIKLEPLIEAANDNLRGKLSIS
jgi:hypothetical protein